MELRPIRTDEDHRWAVAEVERYFDAPDDSPEAAYMDALATLVHVYEQRRWPVEPASPVEILKFSMEQNDRSQSDLAALLGSRSRASEILAGRRDLSLEQIRKIHAAWHIPADLLIGEMAAA